MSKSTPSAVEREMMSTLNAFKDRAIAVKDDYRAKRQAIQRDERLSDSATADIAKLAEDTSAQIKSIKSEQDSYINRKRGQLERELRGNQPTDASSVLLRRDAADRARKITDEKDALAVLGDAVHNGDESLAHAVGSRARQSGWIDALDAYTAAHPDTSDSAIALGYVESLEADPAYNLSNQITYSEPTA